ncbi:unnamed protein product [Closterium sp. NIES-54]
MIAVFAFSPSTVSAPFWISSTDVWHASRSCGLLLMLHLIILPHSPRHECSLLFLCYIFFLLIPGIHPCLCFASRSQCLQLRLHPADLLLLFLQLLLRCSLSLVAVFCRMSSSPTDFTFRCFRALPSPVPWFPATVTVFAVLANVSRLSASVACPYRCLHLCFCADPVLLPIAFPPHPSSLADLLSNLPAPNLPLALGAASTSQVLGIVELSFPPAHNDSLGDATPPPISLSVLAAQHVLASGARLHISLHAADADPASDARFPSSHPVLGADLVNSTRLPTSSHDVCADPASVAHFPASRHGGDTNLANATRLHAFPHGAGTDPASVTRFPALRDAADAYPASATRLPASRCDSSTDPASATHLPASHCDSSTDLANAIRLPIFRCDTSPDPANATHFPISRHDADVAQANATCLFCHDAGADLARADRFPSFRHSSVRMLFSSL